MRFLILIMNLHSPFNMPLHHYACCHTVQQHYFYLSCIHVVTYTTICMHNDIHNLCIKVKAYSKLSGRFVQGSELGSHLSTKATFFWPEGDCFGQDLQFIISMIDVTRYKNILPEKVSGI